MVLVAVALALGAGCGGDASNTAATEDASAAGDWRTWVIGTPEAFRVPRLDQPLTVADGRASTVASDAPAVRPWLERAMTLVARRPKDPVTASRNYALVAVAMYDAAVASGHFASVAGDAEEAPSTDAAIAGAGSRVIAYAYPEFPAAQLDQEAEDVARGLIADGDASSEQAEAGLALGRLVARRVIEVAKRDGSHREWRGPLPRTSGAWRPPPGSVARPVQPLGGTWRTWVLESGRELRPPPPPAYGSAAFKAEARAVLNTHRQLNAKQKGIARFWAGGDGTELPPGRWIRVVLEYLREEPAMSEARVARVFALMTVAMADAGVAAWDAKYAYWVTRPENAIRDLGLDRQFKPYLDTPFFPAYVSGHATYSGAAAEVLAYLFPRDARLWHDRAEEAARSRVYGGIHYPMDGEVGLRMGRRIGERVVQRAERDGADQ
jgi:membrane-associated phospholipid phosphatase